MMSSKRKTYADTEGRIGLEDVDPEVRKRTTPYAADKSYDAGLYEMAMASKRNKLSTLENPPFVLLFRELYTMAIIDLSDQLVKTRTRIADAVARGDDTESVSTRARLLQLLHEYSRTISEFEDMMARDPQFAFPDTGFGAVISKFLGPGAIGPEGEAARLFRNFHSLLVPKEKLKLTKREELRHLLKRFAMAVVGGVLLVVPVVIMSFHESRTRNLVTLSVSTLVFALIVAASAGSQSAPHEIVTPTAAYAAVLAVFLGANSGPVA